MTSFQKDDDGTKYKADELSKQECSGFSPLLLIVWTYHSAQSQPKLMSFNPNDSQSAAKSICQAAQRQQQKPLMPQLASNRVTPNEHSTDRFADKMLVDNGEDLGASTVRLHKAKPSARMTRGWKHDVSGSAA